jgi:predicted O-methyltransferase YrrM
MGNQIIQHLGSAVGITLRLIWICFIDADKENYLTYWELIVPKMNKGHHFVR